MNKEALSQTTRSKKDIKIQAESILQELGIPLSMAQDLFYRQIIAYHGLPFDLRVPNETTVKAMEEARQGKGKQYSTVAEMFDDLEV